MIKELLKKKKPKFVNPIDTSLKAKLEWTWAWPIQGYSSKYIDLNKSKAHVDSTGKLVNEKGYPYWKNGEDEGYMISPDDLQVKLAKLKLTEYSVSCSHCGRELVKFYVENGNKGRLDGILGLRYTQHLMAYRPRTDGLLGLECVCGLGDSRLSTREKLQFPDKYPAFVPHSGEEKARFNMNKGLFKSKEVTK